VDDLTRRALLGIGAGVAVGALAECGAGGRLSTAGTVLPKATQTTPPTGSTSTLSRVAQPPTQPPSQTTQPSPRTTASPDGSTAYTGRQPNQPLPQRLLPGQRPPQFVVVSWDGAGETGAQLFSHYREVARRLRGSMTFFVTGLYFLPQSQRNLYHPPQHPVGASDIGFLSDSSVHATIQQVGAAWTDGHEIGTHFNGHFCGPRGVKRWSPQDWDSEIDQAIGFVSSWRTTTGFTDLPALPFDYARELVGARTPCLEGQANLLRSSRAKQWRYDSSGTGRQVWPTRFPGSAMWNIPMQSIPFPGHRFQVISMDYNIMYNQSGGPQGAASNRPLWKAQARDAFLAGFDRAYTGNRAPLIIGNHFERWNGGIYMEAVESAITEMAAHPDVRFVSFRQLVDWLEAQDSRVLSKLQALGVGQAPPAQDWAAVTAS
jgi:hypothetical protein